ncbi:MAG: phosphoglycerate dehydrogenase [Candidatus Glassbacteria bacterium GWA2_58_10]|uniref:D-3-phosphoglycerate dehydrogenase n=1 Tax=Candidatus Glassbacteria bacterium GWA2_58_10 TaxID=1817865 RepID=A0A1F5YGW6_9BACT|nr:MAG: phosphoglycerate dehydrogenase [Candidatus Glassbacteria bacterium GWA2_58_10]
MKVLVADKISEEGLKILRQTGDIEVVIKTGLDEAGLAEAVKDCEALLIRSGVKVTRKVIEAAQKLVLVGRAGVGVDNVDLDAATERGIVVMNTPSGNTIAAAEHTLGLILALARNIPRANQSLKAGKWERNSFVGRELHGKTLGVAGLGRIGSEVARIGQAFRMKVLAYDPYFAAESAAREEIEMVSLEELLSRSDIVTLHVPASEETKGMLNARTLKLMKPEALLINCARGALVDEKALEQALAEGKLAGAALDVYSKEPPDCAALLADERVVATPHLGASTHEAQINVGVQICRQALQALKEGTFDNAVNMPITDFGLLDRFRHYLALTERIGVFASQFVTGGIRKVGISVAGSCIEALQPLKLALLKGLLTPVTGGNVNFVNAVYLAHQRGITLDTVETESADYKNLISCRITTDKETCRVDGTIFGDELPRIVRINEFYMDVNPGGNMLAIKNADVPGVIGKVGSILGNAGLNIGEYRLGREPTQKNTLSLVSVDSPIPDAVVEELRAVKGMQLVKKVTV